MDSTGSTGIAQVMCGPLCLVSQLLGMEGAPGYRRTLPMSWPAVYDDTLTRHDIGLSASCFGWMVDLRRTGTAGSASLTRKEFAMRRTLGVLSMAGLLGSMLMLQI